MKPDKRFLRQPKSFWANVRSLSQKLGYTENSRIKIPTLPAIVNALEALQLSSLHIVNRDNNPTGFGSLLRDYFQYRAQALNESVRPKLMDKDKAQQEFKKLQRKLCPTCPLPMNKQKGDKRAPAYLTGIINMLIDGAFPNTARPLIRGSHKGT